MRIAISASGKSMDNLLDTRFGRCEYFQIHDIEKGQIKVIENQGQISSGGAGIAAAQQLIDEKVDCIITGNLGPNAFKIIDKAGVKAYKCDSIPIISVLEKYKKGELLELESAGPSHHGMSH